MSKVRDLIRRSLILSGILAEGETPTAEQQQDAFSTLKEMLESWSTENLIIYAKAREEFDLVPNQSVYSFGSTGNFDSSRPLVIDRAAVKITGSNTEIPIGIINEDQWADISQKDTQSAYPTRLYPEGTSPLATLNLWPVPTETNKLVIYSSKPLSEFTTVNDDITLPPGYMMAIRYNLSIQLSIEYQKPVALEVAQIANDSKASVKRMNIKPQYLAVDPALTSGKKFNILTGE